MSYNENTDNTLLKKDNIENMHEENTDHIFSSVQLVSVTKSVLAARFAYLSLGMAMAIWASLIPYTKIRLGVNEGELGLLLLCLGLGATLSMPIAGAFTAKYGCKKMQILGIPIYYGSLFVLSFVPNPLSMIIFLTLFGSMSGLLDVVMNLQVAYLEKTIQKRLMSSLHGMYMVGVALGAGLMILLLGVTKSPFISTCICCLMVLLGFFYFYRYFYPKIENTEKVSFIVIPKGIIFFLGLVCFFLYMIEGVLMDWSALFMIEVKGVAKSQAGTGYALFAITMTLGRMVGDRLGARFGSKPLLVYGVFFCVIFFLGIAFVPYIPLTYVCFFMLGICAANSVPMLFALVTKNPIGSLSNSIAAVSTIGYLGLLAGPAIMGFVAHHFGLAFVFVVMAVFLFCVALLVAKLPLKQ